MQYYRKFCDFTNFSVKKIFIMAKILPHTERFVLTFNKLKNEKKLPSNAILANQLGIGTGNTFTEIRNGRQNISLDALQKFCDIYGPTNGFTFEELAGRSPLPKDDEREWERARIAAIEEQIAILKSMFYDLKGTPRSVAECLDDIETSTKVILARRRQSGK